MADDSPVPLDATDWRILTALQHDGRLSYADLAREVAMSPSAVTERVRRLEELKVITGYRAVVAPDRLGLDILALVRLRYPTGNYRPFQALLDTTPEIVEAHHVTGEDCFVLKVVARSMRHLEQVTGRISGVGAVTTSVVYSSPLPDRDLGPSALGPSAGSAVGGSPVAGSPVAGSPVAGSPVAGSSVASAGRGRRQSMAN